MNYTQMKRKIAAKIPFIFTQHNNPTYVNDIVVANQTQTNGCYLYDWMEPNGIRNQQNHQKGSWLEYGKEKDWKFKIDTCDVIHCIYQPFDNILNEFVFFDQLTIPDLDKFYKEPETDIITWLYYNPDAISNNQFVEHVLNYELIQKAEQATKSASEFFDYLQECSLQNCYDIGTEEYRVAIADFAKEPILFGLTEKTKDRLQTLTKL